MNFDTQAAAAESLARVAADALVVVLVGEAARKGLDKPVGAALDAALADGEFAFKAGKAVLLHHPPKVAAPRLVLAAAADASPKAFHKALAAALALLKAGGSAHVAVWLAGAQVEGDHAEALALAAAEAAYLYRHTKPSAPPAPRLARLTLLVPATEQAALELALGQGAHVAAGVTLARECANRPGNHCTPSFLAEEARRLGRQNGCQVQVLGRAQIEKLGMGSFLAVAQGSSEPMKFIVIEYRGAPLRQAPVVLVGKG
ncbi:MAG: M17 family peptidase N-terminal domain-containing protein, partial [Rubrivivax sp.]